MKKMIKYKKTYIRAAIIISLVFMSIIVLFQTVFFIGFVPTRSMEPTLKENSLILGLRSYDELKKNDIIIFEYEGVALVKRIAAVGGEVIVVGDVSYTVPERCYFVMGDNRDHSYDSRYWDNPYVKVSAIIAKIF